MRRLLIGCGSILLTILVIGLLCSAGYWVVINRVNRQDPQDVGSAFAVALMGNDNEKAKLLSSSSKWDRIDSWIKSHEALHCPFTWDIDEFPTSSALILVPSDKDDTTSITYYYQCGSKFYRFSIDEIVLEQTSEGWVVTDWSYISER